MMSSHVEHDPVGTQATSDVVSFEWRKARYEEMGFNCQQAAKLADSKQVEYTGGKTSNDKKVEWQIPLSWQKVQKALDGGCTHEMAIEIFTT
jgi:hypothetical protein